MATKPHESLMLLRWNEQLSATGVQDPLGLALRGSARLASRLLYCITSITPRARYFSYLPWCIYDYQQREAHQPHKTGLRQAIVLREQALTLACVAHHEGEPCTGGNLVGSTRATKWLQEGHSQISFRRRPPFAKNPALSAYFNSLVNLHLFVTEHDHKADEEADEEDTQYSFEDIRLSPLGLDLAKRLDGRLKGLAAISQIAAKERVCHVPDLRRLGSRAGLCELATTEAPDLPLLRDIFFANVSLGNSARHSSHPFRRRTLLLLLDLCRQLGAAGWHLSEATFASVVYYGMVAQDDEQIAVAVPDSLRDNADRWRMFYFHHYMSVALEGMFAWLTCTLMQYDLRGATIESLLKQLGSVASRKDFDKYSGLRLPTLFGDLCPADLFAVAGIPPDGTRDDQSTLLDEHFRPPHLLAEENLELAIREKGTQVTPLGLMLPLTLLAVTLTRYQRWRNTNHGRWLAKTARGNRLNLVPPLVLQGLEQHLGNWWQQSFGQLAEYVLRRFVVDQHQSMAYVKTKLGDRCLLQKDDNSTRLVAEEGFDKIGMGNPRLTSAIQILCDLGFISADDDGLLVLTADGRHWLKTEMAKEASDGVS
jgi:hypothetical protein